MDTHLTYLKGNYIFSLKSTETALIYQLIFDKIEKFYCACASLKFDLKKSFQYSCQSNIFRLSITYFLCNLLRPPIDLPYFSRKCKSELHMCKKYFHVKYKLKSSFINLSFTILFNSNLQTYSY